MQRVRKFAVRAAKSAEGVSAIHSASNASRASRTAVGHKTPNTSNVAHSEPRDFKLLLDCDVTKCIRVLFITIPSFYPPCVEVKNVQKKRNVDFTSFYRVQEMRVCYVRK